MKSACAAGCRLPWMASTAGWSFCPRGRTRPARLPTATLASFRTARSKCAGLLPAATIPRPGSPACRWSCSNAWPAPPEPEDALPQAIACLRRRLAELRGGRVPPEELLVAQRITREVEDYRSPSPAARAARQLKEPGKMVKPGPARALSVHPGATGRLCLGSPLPPDPATLDLARYQELLLRAAAEVLEPFGVTEKRLC